MRARGPRRLGRLRPEDPAALGPYRLVGRIGSGGMGTVYAGVADGIDGYLAVKVVHGEYAADPGFRRTFAREARLLVRVDSPCVARFVHADVEAERPWLVTEFVAGPTLRHHVERFSALRGGMLLGLAAGTAEALCAVHSAGIVHRDFKPSNVILSATGPKVLDFGIAQADEDPTLPLRLRRAYRRARERGVDPPRRPLRPGGPDAAARTRRPLVGTPGWISPEQYRGQPVTERSDVFLWGALVGFAAARRDPFGHGSPRELARRVVAESPDLAGLPPGLARLVSAALAKDPADRPRPPELLAEVLSLAGRAPEPGASGRQRVRELLAQEWTGVSARPPRPPRRPLSDWLRWGR
ncbi:MAG TPA: serine/threonine-protein kinase [Thermobifida alba]|nr:serine/threonine-protein kinase [Thermobifida alba]